MVFQSCYNHSELAIKKGPPDIFQQAFEISTAPQPLSIRNLGLETVPQGVAIAAVHQAVIRTGHPLGEQAPAVLACQRKVKLLVQVRDIVLFAAMVLANLLDAVENRFSHFCISPVC
jgi:hypothetical protein